MHRKFLSAVLGISALLTLGAVSRADDYKNDPVHSAVVFRIHHFGAAYVWGTFIGPTGTVSYDESDPTKDAFDLTVKADSLDTRSAGRDKDLTGPDFFDVKQFPDLKFKSTSVKAGAGKDQLEVTGDLTLHGVTKSVTVTMDMTGKGSMQGKTLVGFETTFEIKRSDFGITYDAPPLIGDEVRLTVALEADKS